jgi:predicted nucleotidyltransferase
LRGQKYGFFIDNINNLCIFVENFSTMGYNMEYINKIKNIMHKVNPDAEVILYGSQARGEADEESDIDLLILIDKEKLSAEEKNKITDSLYDLEFESNFNVTISPLVYTKNQWHNRPFRTPFYINVMNEGVKLQ